MATDLENLTATKNNLTAKLAEITSSSGFKLTYSIDGQSFSWTEYHKMLTSALKEINELLTMEDPYFETTVIV